MNEPPPPPASAKVKVFDSTMIIAGLGLLLVIYIWIAWVNPWLAAKNTPAAPQPVPVPVATNPAPLIMPPPATPANPVTVAGPVQPAGAMPADADLDADAPAKEIPIETQNGRIKATISTLGGALRFYDMAEPRPLPDSEPRVTLLDALVRKPYAMMSLAVREVKYKLPDAKEWNLITGFDQRTYRVVPVNGQTVELGQYNNWPAQMVTLESRTPLFTLRRKFVFYEEKNGVLPDHVDTELTFVPAAGMNLEIQYKLRGPAGILPDGPKTEPVSQYTLNMGRVFTWTSTQGAAGARKMTQAELIASVDANDKTNLTAGDLNLWTGVQNRFFSAVLIPYEPRQEVDKPEHVFQFYAEPLRQEWLHRDSANPRYGGGDNPNLHILESEAGVIRDRSLAVGQPITDRYGLYVGPSAYAHLRDYDATMPQRPAGLPVDTTLELDQNIEYSSFGWIDYLSRGLVWFLGGVYWLTGSYGLSVVLLTVLVKAAMFPISKKTVVSMEKMKLLQPYMVALKKVYEGKDDQASKQKMSQEMMALYRMNKASPFGSCGPMLVTIPVFLALYNAFWANYDMRHVGYLGVISDLCEPDRIFPIYLDHLWGALPHWFNLMPALYLVLNYIQLSITPQPQTDPSGGNQMKYMTKLMPLMMFFFFYSMPSGLVLYFVASMVYGLAENKLIRKYLYKPEPVEAPAHLKKMAEKMAAESQAAAQSAGLGLAAQS